MTARTLLNRRHVLTACGHVVRLVAFGGTDAVNDGAVGKHHIVSMRHIVAFLSAHVADHRGVYRSAQPKQAALAWLTLLDKLGERVSEDA